MNLNMYCAKTLCNLFDCVFILPDFKSFVKASVSQIVKLIISTISKIKNQIKNIVNRIKIYCCAVCRIMLK